jgi:hypothetical protein
VLICAEKCRIGSGPQNDWYFFSHKDKKYPTGTRTNRATAAGFWKATGRDKAIYTSSRRIGMRKTLVFYKGRAPHGQKSDWIMHEYRLDDPSAGGGGDGAASDPYYSSPPPAAVRTCTYSNYTESTSRIRTYVLACGCSTDDGDDEDWSIFSYTSSTSLVIGSFD